MELAPLAGRLRCIAGEWSGYLASAIETVERAVSEVMTY